METINKEIKLIKENGLRGRHISPSIKRIMKDFDFNAVEAFIYKLQAIKYFKRLGINLLFNDNKRHCKHEFCLQKINGGINYYYVYSLDCLDEPTKLINDFNNMIKKYENE